MNDHLDAISPAIIGTAIGIATGIAGAISASIRGTWRLASIKEEIIRKIESDRLELRDQLTLEHAEVMKQFGDSLAAVREKIVQTELWNRDNFVRRSDFATVVESINKSIDALTVRLDAGIAKIEAKIDKLQSRAP